MSWRRGRDERGVTLVELMLASAIGVVVLLGVFSMYRATRTSFEQSSSQAYLQRQGTLALQAIQRQAQRATTTTYNSCAPASTTSRSLLLTVSVTNPLAPLPLPAAEIGDYCYFAGNGANGAAAGALCERFALMDIPSGVLGPFGPCRDLLAGQGALVRQTGQAGVSLITQSSPADPLCPRNTTDAGGNLVSGGQAIAAGTHCLALGQVAGSTTGDVAFAISDGLNAMTFTASLMLRN